MPKFDLQEKVLIDVEPVHVREIVRDFKQWTTWSPWLSAEPTCKVEYAKDGRSYSWDGEIIGSGQMTITREADDTVEYSLQFHRPWKSQANVAFRFVPSEDGTEVTWSMRSSLPFFMFFMKKMMVAWVSADYRRGLAKLKDYAETGSVPSKSEFSGLGQGFVGKYVGLRASGVARADLGERMTRQFEALHQWMNDQDVEGSAPPLCIYHKFDLVRDRVDYTVAIPVSQIPSDLPAGFETGQLNAPRTYKVRHIGAYRHLSSPWSAAFMHQRNKKFRPNKRCDPFEVYVSDPSTTLEKELVTEVHLPAV